MAEHKLVKKSCPQCGLTKTYEARRVHCSRACASAAAKRPASPVKDAPEGSRETHEKTDDTWAITLPKTHIHTVEELLAYCEVDQSVWEVERSVINKWEMGSKDADGQPQTTPLYQVKAWLRRNKAAQAAGLEIAALVEDAKTRVPEIYVPSAPDNRGSGIMVEISIPDLHMGKLAWAKETGHANYDSQIAARLFQDAVASIMDRTQAHRPEQIVLVVGNDIMNADNIQLTTTRGTPQHSDLRYHKTFKSTRRMVSDAITMLAQLAPVEVVMVPGNHDTLAAWHLGDSLECTFDRAPGVAVRNSPAPRKYHRWGNVMLMWTHGDKGKHAGYPLLMATEQREMFGATSWHEVHLGHLHQVQLRELNGVRVRVLPSLCAPDAWHSEMGYVGNVRSAEAYIWHKRSGLVGTAVFVAPDTDSRVLAA